MTTEPTEDPMWQKEVRALADYVFSVATETVTHNHRLKYASALLTDLADGVYVPRDGLQQALNKMQVELDERDKEIAMLRGL